MAPDFEGMPLAELLREAEEYAVTLEGRGLPITAACMRALAARLSASPPSGARTLEPASCNCAPLDRYAFDHAQHCPSGGARTQEEA